jgi:hypothetical protein
MDDEVRWRATKEKCLGQFELVKSMRVRQKRHIFLILRQCEDLSSDTFLPCCGLHCGEFACFQILAQSNHRKEESCADPAVG